MSILDIVTFSIAGIIVFIYGFITIRKTIKWKKLVKQYMENGMTLLQAKDSANKIIYAKKSKKKDYKEDDNIFED